MFTSASKFKTVGKIACQLKKGKGSCSNTFVIFKLKETIVALIGCLDIWVLLAYIRTISSPRVLVGLKEFSHGILRYFGGVRN